MSGLVYGLYGASGFGQEIMYWLSRQSKDEGLGARIVYIDDGLESAEVDGFQVLNYDEFLDLPEGDKFVAIAIADSALREKIDKKLEADGIRQISVVGANTFVRGASLGEGAVLSLFVDITNNVKTGRCFHANSYSYIGHDCIIGDYVTLAPRVSCNGNVVIEDHVYIGTGAIIKQGTPDKPLVIGKGSVVGMGAVVTKNVPPGAVVVGNPARPFQKG